MQAGASSWRTDRAVRPTVLILGGFLTSPPLYRPLVRRLVARGAAAVVVANVWLPDWLVALGRGQRPAVERALVAFREACELAETRSGGAPLLVVGHSMGGIGARLLTAPQPFEGLPLGGAERIGAIVTLGSPHALATGSLRADRSARFAASVVPGAYWAPRIGYLAVASRALPGDRSGTRVQQARWARYALISAPPHPERIDGDGVVPVETALLPGARTIVTDDLAHGIWRGAWYGSESGIDRWWPSALASWRAALDVRRAEDEVGATRSEPIGTEAP